MKTTEIYTTYAPDTDRTFIIQDTLLDGEIIATEVVGFYFGNPDDKLTETYTGKLRAEFSWEDI